MDLNDKHVYAGIPNAQQVLKFSWFKMLLQNQMIFY